MSWRWFANTYLTSPTNKFSIDEQCSYWFDGEAMKKYGYWTKSRCIEEARKFNTNKEWRERNRTSYNKALSSGWLGVCREHMEHTRHSPNYWTLDKCLESASRFNTRIDWRKNDFPAHEAAYRRGWFEACCAHMSRAYEQWDRAKCIESAKEYTTRASWKHGQGGAYVKARLNGWLDECCKHMLGASGEPGDFRWDVYRIINRDTKEVYFGITRDFKSRCHKRSRKQVANLRADGEYELMFTNATAEQASAIEIGLIGKFSNHENGWNCLNHDCGGGFGALGKLQPVQRA